MAPIVQEKDETYYHLMVSINDQPFNYHPTVARDVPLGMTKERLDLEVGYLKAVCALENKRLVLVSYKYHVISKLL